MRPAQVSAAHRLPFRNGGLTPKSALAGSDPAHGRRTEGAGIARCVAVRAEWVAVRAPCVAVAAAARRRSARAGYDREARGRNRTRRCSISVCQSTCAASTSGTSASAIPPANVQGEAFSRSTRSRESIAIPAVHTAQP